MTPASDISLATRGRLLVEFLVLFGGGPLLLLFLRRPGVLFAVLWISAALAGFAVRRTLPIPHDPGQELRRLLLRFAVLGPLIAAATWWFLPDAFLSLPRQKPWFWLLIMVLYPLLSVWPQEMLYRAFLFARYEPVFRARTGTVIASAVAFGFAHILFLNWIAIAMTLVGGFLFATDYARHRSLRLTCLEHSLYGCLIFTVGLGRFFYTGAAWHHP